MCTTCDNVLRMSRMIQIRNVPDDVHREAKVRAARAGMTLSDYLLKEIERALSYPPADEILARFETRSRPRLSETPAEAIRADRDSR